MKMSKSILDQYLHLKEEIEFYKEKLKNLKEQKEEIISDVVVESGQFPYTKHTRRVLGGDPEAKKRRVQKIQKLMKVIEKMEDSALDMECEVYEYIQKVPDSCTRRIFLYRYLDGLSWEEIGERVFMHRTTVSDKVAVYLKQNR